MEKGGFRMKKMYITLSFFVFLLCFFGIKEHAFAETVWTSGCTTPDNYISYGSAPVYTTSYKYGTEYYTTKDSKGNTINQSRSVTGECTPELRYTSGSNYGGSIAYFVKYTAPGLTTAYQTFPAYYINDIQVSVANYSYQDEKMPNPTCTATYGNGEKKDCTNDLRVSSDTGANSNIRKICYRYDENNHYGEACTTRVYVQSVDMTGPSKSYTGEHQYYTCKATFYDGYSKDITKYSNVWFANPYSYIGQNWKNTGYSRPDGKMFYPTAVNDFYSVDPTSKTYTVYCKYYPNSAANNSNKWVSDPDREKTDSITVQHIGIASIGIDAIDPDTGKAMTYDNSYKYNYDYITGHWYDFKGYVQFTDGRKKYLTSSNAPESFWTAYPWYKGKNAYEKWNDYDTNMTDDGTQHRIPVDGQNTVIFEYFNRNIPYGGNSDGGYINDQKTRTFRVLQSHQITGLMIQGDKVNQPPKTTVTRGSTVNYTAWVIWSDGKKEDFTNQVTWVNDEMITPGTFKFDREGNGNKRTISVYLGDQNRTYGLKDWDFVMSQIEVNVVDNCTNVSYLRWGCPVPTTWQTTFNNPTTNLLPPASIYGLPSWDEKNNPYHFYYEFTVTGISNSVGGS